MEKDGINVCHTEKVSIENERLWVSATLTSKTYPKASQGYAEINSRALQVIEYLKGNGVEKLKVKRLNLPQYVDKKTSTGFVSVQTTTSKKLIGYRYRVGFAFEMDADGPTADVLDWLNNKDLVLGKQIYFVTDETLEKTEMKLIFNTTKKVLRKAKLVAAALTGEEDPTLVTRYINVDKNRSYGRDQRTMNIQMLQTESYGSSSRAMAPSRSEEVGSSDVSVTVSGRFEHGTKF